MQNIITVLLFYASINYIIWETKKYIYQAPYVNKHYQTIWGIIRALTVGLSKWHNSEKNKKGLFVHIQRIMNKNDKTLFITVRYLYQKGPLHNSDYTMAKYKDSQDHIDKESICSDHVQE